MNDSPKPKRRWYQFSLRSLLLVSVAIAAALGYFAERVRTQRSAVAAIREAGGNVVYDWEYCDSWSAEEWLDCIDRQPPFPKWITDYLGDDVFYSVAEVSFPGAWKYTAHECTDDTLTHLHGLPRLKRVTLKMTRVTDEGVEKLQQALPNCRIQR